MKNKQIIISDSYTLTQHYAAVTQGISYRIEMSEKKMFERIEYILGQSIFEHELVKGCTHTEERIKNAKNMNHIARIMRQRYFHVYGKKLSFPKGYFHSRDWKNENHPDFVPPKKHQAKNDKLSNKKEPGLNPVWD